MQRRRRERLARAAALIFTSLSSPFQAPSFPSSPFQAPSFPSSPFQAQSFPSFFAFSSSFQIFTDFSALSSSPFQAHINQIFYFLLPQSRQFTCSIISTWSPFLSSYQSNCSSYHTRSSFMIPSSFPFTCSTTSINLISFVWYWPLLSYLFPFGLNSFFCGLWQIIGPNVMFKLSPSCPSGA